MKKIKLHNKSISYTLKRSNRARRMRLAVYCDGSVVVTTPTDLKETIIEKFLKEKTKWLFSKIDFFKQYDGHKIIRNDRASYLKYKDDAYEVISKKVERFNALYDFRYNKINIKNQKTRWGSCSRKGNLNFNYKIIFLPDSFSDYIVIHELCHLKEFNHSKKFWALVRMVIPDYSEIRRELRKSGNL